MKGLLVAGWMALCTAAALVGSSDVCAADATATAKATATQGKSLRHQRRSYGYSARARRMPRVRSASAFVQDQATGAVLYEKNAGAVVPIASITKLMTAMVVLDHKQPLDAVVAVTKDDVDRRKGSRSDLLVGTLLKREELLNLALMSSENRAASALARNYPGGREAFIAAMNAKARELGLSATTFTDPTGLFPDNVSSARDLAKLVAAAREYPLIREFSTRPSRIVMVRGRPRAFHNTNRLVRSPNWEIDLSKTGYISEAGKCLVMEAWVNDKPTIIVLLDSWGRLTRIGDANRIRHMLEAGMI